ncbi:MAG: DUF302 domain-containing protein [Paludibaculum sp.]
MPAIEINVVHVERWSLKASISFETILARVEREIGHPDMRVFWQRAAAAKTLADLEGVLKDAIGPAGLMEFVRFDHGGILRKSPEAKAGQLLRLVIGNPQIMREMAKHVPDAGSYAPVTVLLDEREDGVYLSYDRMASLLAPYGNPEALQVARDLDSKIEALLTRAAS